MATLTPNPKQQFFDANGNPLVGGKLYTYAAGTTTPLATYTSSTGVTANANPVILDARGEADVWLAAALYKFVLKTAADVTVFTVDNIASVVDISNIGDSLSASIAIDNFTGDGSDVTFSLTNTPVDENVSSVYVNGVYQQKDSYSFAGNVLTFSEAPPYNSSIEVNYY